MKWRYGIFGDGRGFATIDGTFSWEDVLPAVKFTDSATESVLGDASGYLNISKSNLPKNWKDILVTGRTMITQMDGLKVLYAGYLDKINSNLNGSVTLITVGIKEYLARQLANPFYGTQTDPDAVVTFSGVGYTGLLADVIRKGFSVEAPHEDAPRPANVLGNIIATTTATEIVTYESKLSSFETIDDIINTICASLSLNGVEVRYVPRVEEGEKPRIVWDVYIGDDNSEKLAHINESTEIAISLDDAVYGRSSLADLSVTYSVEETGNRIISQSRFGNTIEGTDADITTKTRMDMNIPRFDITYNPEAMLTRDEMDARLSKLLNYESDATTATFGVIGSSEEWKKYLGATLIISKEASDDTAEDFSLKVRCTSVSWSASTKRIDIMVEPMRPRFRRKKDKSHQKPIAPPKGQMPSYKPDVVTPPLREVPVSEIDSGATQRVPTYQVYKKTEWWGAGANNVGQLGVGTTSETAIHTAVEHGSIPEDINLVKIFGTSSKTHGITSDGKVYGWGQLSESLGVDSLSKTLDEPRLAEWFGPKPIKKIIYLDEETTLALVEDGSEIIEISVKADAPLLSYEWKNPPAPIVDIAGFPDTLYAVLENGTVWAKGNSAYMAIGSTVPVRIEEWEQCKQTDDIMLSNIESIQTLYADSIRTDVRVVALLSKNGAIYRMNTSPENDFRPQAWFKLTVLHKAEEVGISPKGLYYLSEQKLLYRAFQQLEEDEELEEFEDASEFKRWKTFKMVSQFRQEIIELVNELVIAIDESDNVWTRGRNDSGELGTGDLKEEDSFKKIEMENSVVDVIAINSRTYIKVST